jgi:S-adenosyl-L-methionine hydrolase (adenosine-forming)
LQSLSVFYYNVQHMSKAPLIALLTDFGLVDPFVGILKAVVSKISPGTPIVDLTHEIPPGEIMRAAVYLWQSKAYFPEGTIFVCVVDPGVGSARRGIVLESSGQIFIGPDNGLFTFVMTPNDKAWEITNQEYLQPQQSATFQGRDVFAPVAAHIALGVEPKAIGGELLQLVHLDSPKLEFTPEGYLAGQTLFADRFGNVMTSLGKFVPYPPHRYRFKPWIPFPSSQADFTLFSSDDFVLQLASGEKLPWVNTFSDLEKGKCGFLVGSSGLIEIVSYAARAEQLLGLAVHEPIILRKSG